MHNEDQAPLTAVRVGSGALLGALAVSTLMSFLLAYRWLDPTSETGGNAYNLAWIVRSLVENLFGNPWGLLAGLAGAAVAWTWTSRRFEAHRE